MCKRALNTICPPGWNSFSGNCYWFVSNPNLLTTWYEAQRKCFNLGALLLTIKSEQEQFYINGFLPDLQQVEVPDIWIGLSDKETDGTFQWEDKKPVTFQNWAPSHPHNTANMWDCGQIYTGDVEGKWETTSCFRNLGYVCKMAGGHNIRPTSAPGSFCDTGYVLFNETCYHFESDFVKNWGEAQKHCRDENGDLASFQNQETLSFLTAHMSSSSWVGLNNLNSDNHFVWSDGTPATFIPWGPGQPDNWHNNEHCGQMLGPEAFTPGYMNDLNCASGYSFICKKGKGQGPHPTPPTNGPGWTEKCGSWVSNPFNEFCYLFQSLSMKTWADARSDCLNQRGDLVSITEPYEQAFIQDQIASVPTGAYLWMGGHDSVVEGGWEWADNSPFRYINWYAGNPDDYYGEDCLDIRIRDGYWNDDNCQHLRGYICKRRGNMPPEEHPHEGYTTVHICEGTIAGITCPHDSVISVQAAMFGRKSDKICPLGSGASKTCMVEGTLPLIRKYCDNRNFCILYAYAENDPCPEVSKYLEVVYTCEQNVCVRGLGMEDGTIPSTRLSASSSSSNHSPDSARLNGNSCWMPSSPANSWIQVDLGETKKVTGIVIQGCPDADHWVTSFKVQSSMDGRTWRDYVNDGKGFPGSVDSTTKETQLFGTPLSVQYIRVLPLSSNTLPGLRMELLGCKSNYTVTCGSVPAYSFISDRKLVHCPAGCASEPYNVFGSGVYRGDSNICAAAIHAGVILNERGGDCTMLRQPGLSLYPGSSRNGITTKQYNGNFPYSYSFADGEMRCAGPDWHEFGDFCYKPFVNELTWQNAHDRCKAIGADLVSIMSLTEQSWLESYLYLATGDVWIGLNDRKINNFFTWSDDHPVKFTYWAVGEPSSENVNSEHCVKMLRQSGRWADVSCSEFNTYICKKAKDHYPAPSIPPAVYGCQEGWDAYGYSCYWYEEVPRRWSEAKNFCHGKNSNLLHIMDIYEQSHFTVKLAGLSGFWWIGLRARGNTTGGVDYIWESGAPVTFTHWDRGQPGYQWSDGSPLGYTNWGPGEPNDHQGREDCVEMVSSSNATSWWNDLNCDAVHNWICVIPKGRKPESPPTPPPHQPAPECGPNPNWIRRPNTDICYLYNDTHHTDFYTALVDCYEQGALLVSIADKEEQSYLTSVVGTGKADSAWIGLKVLGIAGEEYMWVDFSPVTFVNWAKDEPNNANGEEQCVQMKRHPGTWNDMNCGMPAGGYVCKKYVGSHHTPPPPTPAWPGHCPEGWLLFGNKCFLFRGKLHGEDALKANWTFARDWCRAQKGDLAVISDQYENDFVASYLLDIEMSVWIGFSDLHHEGKFTWCDGSQVTYTNWAGGEPNNNGEKGEHCTMMNHNSLVTGHWVDSECHLHGGFVCYMRKSSSIPEPPAPMNPCPAGYTKWRNNCYKLVAEPKSWGMAQAACEAEQGNLASIDQSYDQAFVAGAVLRGRGDAWIGLSRQGNSTYTWTDGWPVFFTHWGPGEPTNHEGDGCVTMSGSYFFHGRWNDTDCNIAQPYICKISSEKPPPTPAPGGGKCHLGWHSYGRYCYWVDSQEKGQSWPNARHVCQQMHAELASIHSRAEVEFLMKLNFTKYHNLWIGLTKDSSYGWAWTDMSPLGFINWAPGEPNELFHPGGGGVEQCVEMNIEDGRWNDNNCLQERGFVCRSLQNFTTDGNRPTHSPSSNDAGVVTAVVIAVILGIALIAGILFYVFKIKGVHLSFPHVSGEPSFGNPNFDR
nr:PREDICTED: macrophage mannose receptor 1-like [Lepisosteus oculatus]